MGKTKTNQTETNTTTAPQNKQTKQALVFYTIKLLF